MMLGPDMTDLDTRPTDDPRPGAGAGAPVSLGRRRFARGAAPVVLGSLLSKPVLGAEYICTVSGHASGNASAHQVTGVVCDVGNTPEEWRDATPASWPSAIAKGALPVVTSSAAPPVVVEPDPGPGKGKKPKPPKGSEAPTDVPSTTASTCTFASPKGTAFNGYAGLANTFYYSTSSCALGTAIETDNAASMYQVLDGSGWAGEAELLELGRAVVASLLNAIAYGNYPVSQARIVEMFNAVKGGGSYFVEGANLSLTRAGVIQYLQKLYTT